MKKTLLFCIIIILVCGGVLFGFKDKLFNNNPTTDNPVVSNPEYDFEYNFIKEVNKSYNKSNYMVSPLSVATALKMLEYGAEGNTYTEINKTLGNYTLLDTFNIENRIGIANGAFIKNEYKDKVLKEYYDNLTNKMKSEIIYDDFVTPDKINEWVNEKTYKMIPSILDDISQDFVLGLANAIAIDVDWDNQFECIHTRSGEFTKLDGTKNDVVMMNELADDATVSFIKNDKAKGIIKDYATYDRTTGERLYYDSDKKNAITLEYIAILPDDFNSYVDNISYKEIKDLYNTKKEGSSKYNIDFYLPRYNYEFDFKGGISFMDSLKNLGINDAFDPSNANFDKILGPNSNIYVATAIHKTKIELNEKGTKAAAVTYFGMEKNAMIITDEPEVETIKFDKPFIYIIKEKGKDNIWFFGTVTEPEMWNKDTVTCAEYK